MLPRLAAVGLLRSNGVVASLKGCAYRPWPRHLEASGPPLSGSVNRVVMAPRAHRLQLCHPRRYPDGPGAAGKVGCDQGIQQELHRHPSLLRQRFADTWRKDVEDRSIHLAGDHADEWSTCLRHSANDSLQLGGTWRRDGLVQSLRCMGSWRGVSRIETKRSGFSGWRKGCCWPKRQNHDSWRSRPFPSEEDSIDGLPQRRLGHHRQMGFHSPSRPG